MKYDQAIIIRSKTRLEQLIERFNTRSQAEFYVNRTSGNFEIYEKEHASFYDAFQQLQKLLQGFPKTKVLDRAYLANYLFTKNDLIIVIGQDGLVANAAKYVGEQLIIAVNPDPETYDGILLPYHINNVKDAIDSALSATCNTKEVTMAEAKFSDGQSLLAFNDFFIGTRGHVSARYTLKHRDNQEAQSSSGIIVSTGAGSTGWMSSIMNMVNGISRYYQSESMVSAKQPGWEENKLVFAVREPFLSKTSRINLCYGEIRQGESLYVESQMPDNGIVFSDGIEADAIRFTTGISVEIGISEKKAKLIVP